MSGGFGNERVLVNVAWQKAASAYGSERPTHVTLKQN